MQPWGRTATGMRCGNFVRSSKSYQQFKFTSMSDQKQYYIGDHRPSSTWPKCSDIANGIVFTMDIGNSIQSNPMRFNKLGGASCYNYDPTKLDALAKALGFSKAVGSQFKTGNSCATTYTSASGGFSGPQRGIGTTAFPFTITFTSAAGATSPAR